MMCAYMTRVLIKIGSLGKPAPPPFHWSPNTARVHLSSLSTPSPSPHTATLSIHTKIHESYTWNKKVLEHNFIYCKFQPKFNESNPLRI